MAIAEVFIQVTDVPLSLWKQQGPRWPQMRIPIGTRALGTALGVKKQGRGAHPCPMQAPTSALQCYSRDHERPERRGRKRQE